MVAVPSGSSALWAGAVRCLSRSSPPHAADEPGQGYDAIWGWASLQGSEVVVPEIRQMLLADAYFPFVCEDWWVCLLHYLVALAFDRHSHFAVKREDAFVDRFHVVGVGVGLYRRGPLVLVVLDREASAGSGLGQNQFGTYFRQWCVLPSVVVELQTFRCWRRLAVGPLDA